MDTGLVGGHELHYTEMHEDEETFSSNDETDTEEDDDDNSEESSDDNDRPPPPTGAAAGEEGAARRRRKKKKRAAKKNAQTTTVAITTVGLRTGFSASLYPFEMAKILMQLGYEPKLPTRATTIFGRPSLLLFNSFRYIKYIKQVDGFFGCFRGFTPYFAHQLGSVYITNKVSHKITKLYSRYKFNIPKEPVSASGEARNLDTWTVFFGYVRGILRDLVSKGVATIICYPLRTMACLTVSEFVGREGIMKSGFFVGMWHIYKTDGISRFYAGLWPRLLGESILICTLGLAGFILKVKVTHDEPRACLSMSFSILMSALVYPFNVVSTTMSVYNSGWALGSSPYVQNYKNWKDCWSRLAAINVLRRGSSLLFRYYTGPMTADGSVIPTVGIVFGPDYTAQLLSPERAKY